MNWISRRQSRLISRTKIYDALKQGDVLVRLVGLRVLRIGDDVYANGEKIDFPHRPAYWMRSPATLR